LTDKLKIFSRVKTTIPNRSGWSFREAMIIREGSEPDTYVVKYKGHDENEYTFKSKDLLLLDPD